MIEASLIPRVFDSLLRGIDSWRAQSAKNQKAIANRDNAINTVLEAVIETKAYLHDKSEAGQPDRIRERALAIAWQHAAAAIRQYDRELFDISGVKALGYADPNEWAQAEISPRKLKLETIIRQCRFLQEQQ